MLINKYPGLFIGNEEEDCFKINNITNSYNNSISFQD